MLNDFLKETLITDSGIINTDVVNKYIQFNFDTTEKCGGVYLINNVFITISKKDGYSSVINLINSIQTFQYTNFQLTHIVYTEIENGNKIIVDRLSTDYNEKNKFIAEIGNLCNVPGIRDNKKHLQHRKHYYYKCLLQRAKLIKVKCSEPFIIKEHYLTPAEVDTYKLYNLGGMIKRKSNNLNTLYVDDELYKQFKRERRISIIGEL